MTTARPEVASRFDRLASYVETDPENLSLLADAAGAAFDEGRLEAAVSMVDGYAAVSSLPPSLINLLGLVALRERRFEDAKAVFEALRANDPADAGLRANLAWALSGMGDHAAVADLLDNETCAAVPGVARLKVQALHHLDRLDDALAIGATLDASKSMHDDDLWGALASVALDAEDQTTARAWAERSLGSADSQATLGMLALAAEDDVSADGHFTRALAMRSDSARALLGLGLTLLERGDPQEARHHLDAAALAFGDHLGTWIAAGWAHLLANNPIASRDRFQQALAIDESFSEAHGGLALLDIMSGDMESARRRVQTALRLDRHGMGGLLAQTMLLDAVGDMAAAARIREAAFSAPIGPQGRTIAQAMARAASRRR